jgi:hypothetical protein
MPSRHDYDNSVEKLRHTPEIVDNLVSKRNGMNQAQSQLAQIDTAANRIEHLQTIADRGWDRKYKMFVTLVVASVAVASFSLGFRTVLRKSGNPLADGASAILAIALVYFIDDRTTKVITKIRSRNDTQSAIDRCQEAKQNHVPKTQTSDAYGNTCETLIRDQEPENLNIKIRGDLSFIILGITVESTAAIVLIYPTGGLLLALLGATLPLTFICLVAAFQSDRFEFPEHCERLIARYEQFLPDSDFVDEEQMLEVLKLQAGVDYISRKNGNGFKSLAQAEFAAEFEFSQERQLHYKTAEIERIRARKDIHNSDLQAVSGRFNPSDLSELSSDDNIDNARKLWIESEKSRLEQIYQDDISFIHTSCVEKVRFWKERGERAQAHLNRNDLDERTAA